MVMKIQRYIVDYHLSLSSNELKCTIYDHYNTHVQIWSSGGATGVRDGWAFQRSLNDTIREREREW